MRVTDTPHGDDARAAFIHRDILQLCAVIAAVVAAFFATRAVAANNREMSLRDAAEWYRRGQEWVKTGRNSDAIEAFRRATVRNRQDKTYVLALARALALNRDRDAARSVLLALRDSAPEDADINLELARLAAARQDVTEAVRFYHNALYAPWPLDQTESRRGVRFELIRFLLAHNQQSRAISELVALSTDLPDEPARHVALARLFSEAGDHAHALEHFRNALRTAPDDGDALAGAGLAALELGEYAQARRFLHRAPASVPRVRQARDIVDLVLSRDPLATHLGSAERRRRLNANLDDARQRLNACVARRGGGAQSIDDELNLQTEAESFGRTLERQRVLEQDTVEAGVDLVDRIEQQVVRTCGPASVLDDGLMRIGRLHR
jgi:tetratricopeptide (TPR) repeat protein